MNQIHVWCDYSDTDFTDEFRRIETFNDDHMHCSLIGFDCSGAHRHDSRTMIRG